MNDDFDDADGSEMPSTSPPDFSPRVNRSAASQDRIIPSKWKPTVAEPIPVVRCTATAKSTGKRCNRWSIRGTTVCIKHGGRLPDVAKHAEAVVEAARLRIIGLTDVAIDQIEDLMVNASGEGIRLKAAQDVLDRAGVKGAIEVDVTVTQTETAAERVQRRLETLSKRLTKAEEPVEEDEEDIVDVDIISEEGGDSSGS